MSLPPPARLVGLDLTLTADELALAVECASFRCKEALSRLGANPNDYHERAWADRWSDHFIGATGEVAVARHLAKPWSPRQPYGRWDPDLPPDIEVRTRRDPRARLGIHPTDLLDRRFVLVVILSPTKPIIRSPELPTRVRIVGMTRGTAAVGHDEWWADPGGKGHPAWFVPQEELTPPRRPVEADAHGWVDP